jgi:hypothetical protein
MISVSTMFPSQRKWLAWRTSAHEINLAFIRPKINLADITFDRFRPLRDRIGLVQPISADRVATPAIPFDHFDGEEPRLTQSHAQSACPREEFD